LDGYCDSVFDPITDALLGIQGVDLVDDLDYPRMSNPNLPTTPPPPWYDPDDYDGCEFKPGPNPCIGPQWDGDTGNPAHLLDGINSVSDLFQMTTGISISGGADFGLGAGSEYFRAKEQGLTSGIPVMRAVIAGGEAVIVSGISVAFGGAVCTEMGPVGCVFLGIPLYARVSQRLSKDFQELNQAVYPYSDRAAEFIYGISKDTIDYLEIYYDKHEYFDPFSIVPY